MKFIAASVLALLTVSALGQKLPTQPVYKNLSQAFFLPSPFEKLLETLSSRSPLLICGDLYLEHVIKSEMYQEFMLVKKGIVQKKSLKN